MALMSYRKRGLILERGSSQATETQVRDLQRDLRQLGYLKVGIDGRFGSMTEQAVKALQYDLLRNDGRSQKNDGEAPVRVVDFNRGRVVDMTGVVDQKLAGCISDMLDHPKIPALPKADDPKAENSRIREIMKTLPSQEIPIPFLMAILQQESGLKHYNEPSRNDADTYITVGLDRNASEKYIITSRGYGAGQYTLFHHPPSKEEVEDFMLDVGKNVIKAAKELKYKFDQFVNGDTTGTRADDRIAESGDGPLRLCKYSPEDPHYMKDCQQCMVDAGQQKIVEGNPVFKGSSIRFLPTDIYSTGSYESIPIRKNIRCDWPYAARRYNGAGINSYHYQVRVLGNVLNM